jgi:hypothetical protein
MPVQFGLEVKMTGPFFAKNPPAVIQRAVRDGLQDIVDRGMDLLADMAKPRPGGVYLTVAQAGRGRASTGHFRRSMHGEVKRNVGRIYNNVIYGPWLEGTSSRNQTTRFKGYAMFRRTKGQVDKEAPDILNRAVRRAVGKLD